MPVSLEGFTTEKPQRTQISLEGFTTESPHAETVSLEGFSAEPPEVFEPDVISPAELGQSFPEVTTLEHAQKVAAGWEGGRQKAAPQPIVQPTGGLRTTSLGEPTPIRAPIESAVLMGEKFLRGEPGSYERANQAALADQTATQRPPAPREPAKRFGPFGLSTESLPSAPVKAPRSGFVADVAEAMKGGPTFNLQGYQTAEQREREKQLANELVPRLEWYAEYGATLGGLMDVTKYESMTPVSLGPGAFGGGYIATTKPKEKRGPSESELLKQRAEEFTGFGPALMPLAGELGKTAVEWAAFWPALFKGWGMADDAIREIPQVKRAIEAVGGAVEASKIAKAHPYLTQVAKEAVSKFPAGVATGATAAGIEDALQEQPLTKTLHDMAEQGMEMGAITSAFGAASAGDKALWLQGYSKALSRSAYNRIQRDASRLRSEGLAGADRQRLEALGAVTGSGTEAATQVARTQAQYEQAIRNVDAAVTRRISETGEKALREIDLTMKQLSARVFGRPVQKMYGENIKEFGDPEKAAEYYLKYGKLPPSLEAKLPTVEREPELSTGQGVQYETRRVWTDRPVPDERIIETRTRPDGTNEYLVEVQREVAPTTERLFAPKGLKRAEAARREAVEARIRQSQQAQPERPTTEQPAPTEAPSGPTGGVPTGRPPQEAKVATPGAGQKKPWQKTKAEFFPMPANSSAVKSKEGNIYTGETHSQAYTALVDAGDTFSDAVEDTGWFVDGRYYPDNPDNRLEPHAEIVRAAYAEGQDVPREAVEEYKGKPWADKILAEMDAKGKAPAQVDGGLAQSILSAVKDKEFLPADFVAGRADKQQLYDAASWIMEQSDGWYRLPKTQQSKIKTIRAEAQKQAEREAQRGQPIPATAETVAAPSAVKEAEPAPERGEPIPAGPEPADLDGRGGPAAEGAGKQPWQMTQEEYVDEAEYRYADWHKVNVEERDQQGLPRVKQPAPAEGPREAIAEHRAAIIRAIRNGQDVPDVVLREYTDIASQYGKQIVENRKRLAKAGEETAPEVGEKIVARPNHVYRAGDRADDFVGMGDRSYSSGLQWYEGNGFLVEYSGESVATEASTNPNAFRGNMSGRKVTRVYYEPEAYTQEAQPKFMAELQTLREQFPDAQFVRLKTVENPATGDFERFVADAALAKAGEETAQPTERIDQSRVLIHETDTDFDTFDLSKATTNTEAEWYGRGAYFQRPGTFKIEHYGPKKVSYILPPNAKIMQDVDLIPYLEAKGKLPALLRDKLRTFASETDLPSGYELAESGGRYTVFAPDGSTIGGSNSTKGLALKKAYNQLHGLSDEAVGQVLSRDIFRAMGPQLANMLQEDGYVGFEIDGEVVIYDPSILVKSPTPRAVLSQPSPAPADTAQVQSSIINQPSSIETPASPAQGREKVVATSPESEVRLNLRAGTMAGMPYKEIFRPVGSNQAVVEIMGQRFTIDNSERLSKQAGMTHIGGRGKSTLPGKTQRQVTEYFAQFPKLGPEDFAIRTQQLALPAQAPTDVSTPEVQKEAAAKPWAGASVEDESRWYGTKVTVAPEMKGETEFSGTLTRVLNGGKLVEVKPDGYDSSFRYDSSRVRVTELVDAGAKGVPVAPQGKAPALPEDLYKNPYKLAAKLKAEGVGPQEAYSRYVQAWGLRNEPLQLDAKEFRKVYDSADIRDYPDLGQKAAAATATPSIEKGIQKAVGEFGATRGTPTEMLPFDIATMRDRVAYLEGKIAKGYRTFQDKDELARANRSLKKLEKEYKELIAPTPTPAATATPEIKEEWQILNNRGQRTWGKTFPNRTAAQNFLEKKITSSMARTQFSIEKVERTATPIQPPELVTTGQPATPGQIVPPAAPGATEGASGKVAELPEIDEVLWHASRGPLDLEKKFKASNFPDGLDLMDYMGLHLGTYKAAKQRTKSDLFQGEKAVITPVTWTVNHPFGGKVWTEDDLRDAIGEYGQRQGITNQKNTAVRAKEEMQKEGYDGIFYRNTEEDKGSVSVIVFGPDAVKPGPAWDDSVKKGNRVTVLAKTTLKGQPQRVSGTVVQTTKNTASIRTGEGRIVRVFREGGVVEEAGEQAAQEEKPQVAAPITKEERDQLVALGYKVPDILKMEPREARGILGIAPEPAAPIVSDADRKIIDGLRDAANAMQSQIDAKRNPAIANQNVTARRANIAAGMASEGDALAEVQKALRALADARENGTLPESLAKVTKRTQIDDILHNKDMPRAHIHKAHQQSMLRAVEGVRGSVAVRDALSRARQTDWGYFFDTAELMDAEERLVKLAASKGETSGHWATDSIKDARRMMAAGFFAKEQFQQAKKDLQDLMGPQKKEPEVARQIREKTAKLIGVKIPGFFPTPKPVAEGMVEAAEIEPGMTVLEPSAGKGDLADVIREQTGIMPDTIEQSAQLADILRLKGYTPTEADFLEQQEGQYDRIVMNPPYEKGQDIDHVRHAYDLLKPGGRIVALMSEGVFGRSDTKATGFREWLDEVGGTSEKLEQGSFTGKEAFRQTGTAIRQVVIDKPADASEQIQPKEEKEIPDVTERKPEEPTPIVEPAAGPGVEPGQARPVVSGEAEPGQPTGGLDPTKYDDALEITKQHAEYVSWGQRPVEGLGGIPIKEPTSYWEGIRDTRTNEVLYTPDQVSEAYRTVQKSVPSPIADTKLWAMPGHEAEIADIGKQMAGLKKLPAEKIGPTTLPKPTGLPKADPSVAGTIKAVHMASADKKETGRYPLAGVFIEGDTIVATDGRRLFAAKGKKGQWGKDGLYIDDAAQKKGSLGKKGEGNFPKWRDIVPDVAGQQAIEVKELATVWRRVRQAKMVNGEEYYGVVLILNKDGSLGFATGTPEVGHVEINIQEGGAILGAVRDSFLLDVLAFHAKRGDTSFELFFNEFDRPMMTRSTDGRNLTVTMPITPDDTAMNAAREAIKTFEQRQAEAKTQALTEKIRGDKKRIEEEEEANPALTAAIQEKDFDKLKALLDATKEENNANRAEFQRQTGIALPDSVNGTENAIGGFVMGQSPKGKLPGGREAGGTTFIPDLAAEVRAVAAGAVQKPATIADAVLRAIRRNLATAPTYFSRLGEAGLRIAKDVRDIAFRSQRSINNDLEDFAPVFRGLTTEQIQTLAKTMYPRTKRVSVKDEHTGKVIGHRTVKVKDKKTGQYLALVDPETLPDDMKARAKELLRICDKSMNAMAAVGGLRRTKDGQYITPTGVGFAYPNSLNELGMRIMQAAHDKGKSDPAVFEWAQEQVEAGHFGTVDEAILALQNLRELSLRGTSGYLERSRILLPEAWIDWNAKQVLPTLVQKNWLLVEAIRRWGYEISLDPNDPQKVRRQLNFPRLRPLVEKVRVEHGKENAAKIMEFVKATFLHEYTSPEWLRTITGKLRAMQFTTKVGSSIVGIIRNMLDRLPKGMAISIPDTILTLKDYPPFINGFIKSSRELEERMVRAGAVMGSTGLAEDVEPGKGLKALTHRPFAASEAGNQVTIAAVAYRRLLRDIAIAQQADPRGAARIFRVLIGSGKKAVGARLGDLFDKAARGEITQDDTDRFLHEAVIRNAYPILLSTKPVWWDNHPILRLAAQFKVWPVKQSSYILHDVLAYTAKTGDLTRLLGFLLGTLIAGELYNIIRDVITDRRESVLLGDKKKIWSAILNDLLDGGIVGILADFSYGIYDWAEGPTLAMLEDISTASRHIIENPTPEQAVQAAAWFAEQQLSVVRQVKGIVHKFDTNPNDMLPDYTLWRSRSWDWKDKLDNPTLGAQMRSWTEEKIWGRPEYEPGANTLSLHMANRQVVVGDVGDATRYLNYIFSGAEPGDAKATVSAVKSSMTRNSPLGPIPEKDRKAFLQSLTPEERQAALKAQQTYLSNYAAAMAAAQPYQNMPAAELRKMRDDNTYQDDVDGTAANGYEYHSYGDAHKGKEDLVRQIKQELRRRREKK